VNMAVQAALSAARLSGVSCGTAADGLDVLASCVLSLVGSAGFSGVAVDGAAGWSADG